jgi:hypothetical protein
MIRRLATAAAMLTVVTSSEVWPCDDCGSAGFYWQDPDYLSDIRLQLAAIAWMTVVGVLVAKLGRKRESQG